MERIEHFKKELAKKRKMAAESHRTVQTSTKFEPVKSLMPLTKPTTFHFATDERLKTTEKEHEKTSKDFVNGLRDHSRSPVSCWLAQLIVEECMCALQIS